MIKVRAYGYGVRDGFTPFCITSSKNSREADGSGERSVAGRECLWGGEGFQAEDTWPQTGHSVGAWHGQGLPWV